MFTGSLAEKSSLAIAAKELGQNDNQIYTWRTVAVNKATVSDREAELQTEVAKLKRQLAVQAEELTIVKKAAYFAKNQKSFVINSSIAMLASSVVSRMASMLDVSRSGYYAWKKASDSPSNRLNWQQQWIEKLRRPFLPARSVMTPDAFRLTWRRKETATM